MKRTALTVAVLVALIASAAPRAAGQSKAFVPGRTPDGQPDLRGTWVNFDSTPFEAPAGSAAPAAAPIPSAPGINPPSHWADHDSPMKAARRSMVVDPPNGRVPVMKWAEDKRAYDLDHVQDHEVHQTSWERCITRGMPAGMFPAGYNNAYEFIQTPGYVVIRYEMIHNARIIPIDGRPRLGEKIRQWDGEPRGHWEGTTLVVESTNYNDKGMIATSAATQRIRGIPQSEALHVIERFTPVDADTIVYRATVEDKNVYTGAWTVEIPLTRDSKYRMFEYACQEGNYATPNILAGGRAAEREAAKGTNP
jgi:hypothetical protein